MTNSDFAAIVTGKVHDLCGPDYEFDDDFEGECARLGAACGWNADAVAAKIAGTIEECDFAYWLNGTPYCGKCVESKAPCMSEDERQAAQYKPGVGQCGCCKKMF